MADKATLPALAERCEKATADEQGALLGDAYRAIFPHVRSRDHTQAECEAADLRAYRFFALLDAGAFLDAAMTLVPEGRCVSAMGEVPDDREWYVEIWKDGDDHHQGEVRGKSAALALTAAALRARARKEVTETAE